jgi:hypothetical protein
MTNSCAHIAKFALSHDETAEKTEKYCAGADQAPELLESDCKCACETAKWKWVELAAILPLPTGRAELFP